MGRHATLQTRYASDTLRFRHASLQTSLGETAQPSVAGFYGGGVVIAQYGVIARSLVFAIVFLVSLNFVYGLGITPGRTTVNFEPDLRRDVEFEIVNTGDANLNGDGNFFKLLIPVSVEMSPSDPSGSLDEFFWRCLYG